MAEKVQRKTAKPARKRRQWQRPQVKSGQLFEANSLACGKNGSGEQDPGMCMDQGFNQS